METVLVILALVAACVVFVVVGNAWFLVCAWLGHVVVRILTFGKVQLDWHRNSECFLTYELGLVSLLLIAGLVAWAIHG